MPLMNSGRSAGRSPGRPRIPPRLILAVVVALVSIGGYFLNSSKNPVTGRTQQIALSMEQEIALGLQSAPEMARQFGGVSSDPRATDLVKSVGAEIVAALPPDAPPYRYDFHLLADPQTVNAFALPGGQVFITTALLTRLETEGQLAGVLGHEVGHVLGRHSAQQMAKAQLAQGLAGAAGMAGGDTAMGAQSAQAVAGMVGKFLLLKYGREDELEADRLGLRFMHAAGYDPRSLIGVMKILEEASGGASADRNDFSATHPNPGRRIEVIERTIAEMFPGGVPGGLRP
ncbi:MAG: M48 family metalloprotease [Phycisphaerales bacterium]